MKLVDFWQDRRAIETRAEDTVHHSAAGLATGWHSGSAASVATTAERLNLDKYFTLPEELCLIALLATIGRIRPRLHREILNGSLVVGAGHHLAGLTVTIPVDNPRFTTRDLVPARPFLSRPQSVISFAASSHLSAPHLCLLLQIPRISIQLHSGQLPHDSWPREIQIGLNPFEPGSLATILSRSRYGVPDQHNRPLHQQAFNLANSPSSSTRLSSPYPLSTTYNRTKGDLLPYSIISYVPAQT